MSNRVTMDDEYSDPCSKDNVEQMVDKYRISVHSLIIFYILSKFYSIRCRLREKSEISLTVCLVASIGKLVQETNSQSRVVTTISSHPIHSLNFLTMAKKGHSSFPYSQYYLPLTQTSKIPYNSSAPNLHGH